MGEMCLLYLKRCGSRYGLGLRFCTAEDGRAGGILLGWGDAGPGSVHLSVLSKGKATGLTTKVLQHTAG